MSDWVVLVAVDGGAGVVPAVSVAGFVLEVVVVLKGVLCGVVGSWLVVPLSEVCLPFWYHLARYQCPCCPLVVPGCPLVVPC